MTRSNTGLVEDTSYSAYCEGQIAFNACRPVTVNPYAEGCTENKEFKRGWEKAATRLRLGLN